MSSKPKKVIVIGAGASGMLAAGKAAEQGAEVLLLEKKKKPGNKLLISGKGRCNLTNNSEISEFIQNFNREGRFLHQPFSQFFAPQLMAFFQSLGVELITERGGRVFPASGKASDIVDALLRWTQSNGVMLQSSSPVTRILIKDGRINGVRCNRKSIRSDAAILATGGATYPATGSTGDGYSMAENLGHSIKPLRPALVPLLVDDQLVKSLAGLDLRNTGFRVYVDGKRKKADFGEVSFTTTGVGGPITLTHSLFIIENLRAGKNVTISLDLKPALDEHKLDNRLQRDFARRHNESIFSVLRGLLPQQLISTALQFCSLNGQKSAGQISAAERKRIRQWLKNFRLPISGHRPLSEAIITAGGINVKEIDPNTMESKIIESLYIVGELLDIHGDTGGYNLQAAFSTGWLAGLHAAQIKDQMGS